MRAMAMVKICGVTSLDDAVVAEDLGASYVGMILGEGRRAVDLGLIRETSYALSRAKLVVVATSRERLIRGLEAVEGVRIFQIHYGGSLKDLELAESYGISVIPVIISRGREGRGFFRALRGVLGLTRGIEYVLIDGDKTVAGAGPAGLRLPLEKYSAACSEIRPCGVGGGIRPENVALLSQVRPDVIDVSSGVESSEGKKDPAKIRALVEAARNV